MEGELLAEYAPDGSQNSPQKEYGYRNDQLLITADQPQTTRKNFALRANGGSASASSEISAGCSIWPARGAIDGDRKGAYWGSNGGWADSSSGSFSNDWFQVDFDSTKTIDELDIFTLQDNPNSPSEPTEAMTFGTYGLTAYSVSYWNGSAWINIPEASVVGNNKVWRKFTFSPITTTKIRVFPQAASDNGYSRLTEVEAWGTVTTPAKTNVALRSNGAVATASSEISAGCETWPARGANDGDRKGAYWGGTGGWADSSSGNFTNDWLHIDFAGSKTIDEIDVFTLQDNYANPVEPTENTTFSTYGLTAYDVSYWNGSNWVQISNTIVTGNNKVWRKFTFNAITTTKIRVYARAAVDNGFSRIAEIEAWSPTESSGSSGTHWLVSDHLGTPRMVIDHTGSLGGIKRHDYLPFGEELRSQQGLRTEALGYSSGDGVRQQFTQYERDIESDLDYAHARYYSSTQGRFTGADIPLMDQYKTEPQSWNLYVYVGNKPLNYTDPFGLWKKRKDCEGNSPQCYESDSRDDTYKSLAKILGVSAKALAGHFQNQTIKLGQVLDVSGFFANNQPVQQAPRTHLEVIIWQPFAPGSVSVLGHVSFNINGKNWSWEKNGWDKERPFSDYLNENNWRDGVGYVLDDDNDPKWAADLAKAIQNYHGSWSPINGNCGEAFCRATKEMGLANNDSVLPLQQRAYILNKLRPYIKSINHYNKGIVTSQPVSRK